MSNCNIFCESAFQSNGYKAKFVNMSQVPHCVSNDLVLIVPSLAFIVLRALLHIVFVNVSDQCMFKRLIIFEYAVFFILPIIILNRFEMITDSWQEQSYYKQNSRILLKQVKESTVYKGSFINYYHHPYSSRQKQGGSKNVARLEALSRG